MSEESLTQQVKKLEKYVMTLPAAKKTNTMSSAPKKAMSELADSVYSLRRNTEKYFGSDDTLEQAMYLEEAIFQAEVVNEAILNASSYDLLDAADVAHLSALADMIKKRLK